MDTAQELRRQERFAVRGRSVWLDWWVDDGCVGARAELVNISSWGAMTSGQATPRVGQQVEFSVEGLEPRARLAAVVVGTRGGQVENQVHLRFSNPCPVGILQAVVVDRAPQARRGFSDSGHLAGPAAT